MELIDIIISILAIAGFFFIVVVSFSYLISKSRKDIDKKNIVKNDLQEKRIIQNKIIRNTQYPNILDRTRNLTNSKIVRISPEKQYLTIEEIEERKKNGKNLRYSIINEKIKVIDIKATNYY